MNARRRPPLLLRCGAEGERGAPKLVPQPPPPPAEPMEVRAWRRLRTRQNMASAKEPQGEAALACDLPAQRMTN